MRSLTTRLAQYEQTKGVIGHHNRSKSVGVRQQFVSVAGHGGLRVERYFRTAQEAAASALATAKMPSKFFLMAMETFNYVRNRRERVGKLSRMGELLKKEPDQFELFPFGCRVVVPLPDTKVRCVGEISFLLVTRIITTGGTDFIVVIPAE